MVIILYAGEKLIFTRYIWPIHLHVQYEQYFFRFSYVAVFHLPKGLRSESAKYENIGKHQSYYTWNHAITMHIIMMIKITLCVMK